MNFDRRKSHKVNSLVQHGRNNRSVRKLSADFGFWILDLGLAPPSNGEACNSEEFLAASP